MWYLCFSMSILECQKRVVWFVCNWEEGGILGDFLGSSLARLCITSMTRIPNVPKYFEGGRGVSLWGLLGPGLVSLFVVLLPRIRSCAQIL